MLSVLYHPWLDSNVSMKWKHWKSKELGHAPWFVALWG
jgi:hypothetical protein